MALEAKLPKEYWVDINRLLVPFGKYICTGKFAEVFDLSSFGDVPAVRGGEAPLSLNCECDSFVVHGCLNDAMDKAAKINLLSLCTTSLLLIFLPTAGKFRSPGGISGDWYVCAFAAATLLLLHGVWLKALWREKLSSRLWLYISTGVVVGVLFVLLHLWQEYEQFDYERHGGKGYYADHPPTWRP